jgi:hypothetical protein
LVGAVAAPAVPGNRSGANGVGGAQ